MTEKNKSRSNDVWAALRDSQKSSQNETIDSKYLDCKNDLNFPPSHHRRISGKREN